jgi:hypothetical protein
VRACVEIVDEYTAGAFGILEHNESLQPTYDAQIPSSVIFQLGYGRTTSHETDVHYRPGLRLSRCLRDHTGAGFGLYKDFTITKKLTIPCGQFSVKVGTLGTFLK